MRLTEFVISRIMEGGNIFKDAEGNIVTQNINKADIVPTLKWLEKLTGLPLIGNTLGSVGKKATSGDLDIAVDQNTISKDELVSKLSTWLGKQGEDPKQWVKKSGISVHFKTPIKGSAKNGFVQTDFMFGENIEHMKFGLFAAGEASKFSGADRNLLMSSVAKSLPGDFKYSWQKGLIKRSTGDSISRDPNDIASVLLGKGHTGKDLESVEAIIGALKKDPQRIANLKKSMENLRNTEGKKPGEIKADAEEADRIQRFLSA